MGTEEIVIEGFWVISMVSLNQYCKKDENGFQICKLIMVHRFAFNCFLRKDEEINYSFYSVSMYF